MSTGRDGTDWQAAASASHEKLLAAVRAGRVDERALDRATVAHMMAALTLTPAPRDPIAHLGAAHVEARRHLAHLAEHDPAKEVRAALGSWTYTPRKALRRVLDHVLDHLNQIDQWLAWQRDGVSPTPTDGWAPSQVTLPEDRLPLVATDLDAWLWRIDQATRLFIQRVGSLSNAEIDWQPPDGGWPLRRVAHHVARDEVFYAASLDEALPEDAMGRYAEASRRLGERLRAGQARVEDASIIYAHLYGAPYTVEEAVREVLTIESELLKDAASRHSQEHAADAVA